MRETIPGEPPLSAWADLLEGACAACPRLGVRSVRVLSETASTQDAAWGASGGAPGWLVVAGRQSAGRGRFGRAWADTRGLGLAMTLTLRSGAVSAVGVGLATCRAGAAMLPDPVLGLRWPNDVVERAEGLKVAGALIEARDGVALVGIGVNVGQRAWGRGLRGRAASLHELGSSCTRPELACAVLRELERAAGLSDAEIAREATALDTLRGATHCFKHHGRRYEGVVEAIEPDASIRVRLRDGTTVDLPAQATSVLHE